MQALIGRKIGMTQILQEDGVAVPVTILQAGPCTVTQIRDQEQDGYTAVQLGFEESKKQSKPMAGHTKKSKLAAKIIREFRVDDVPEDAQVGASFDVTKFNVGDQVTVRGVSKGKGFAGTVKRHNFNTSKSSHGGKGSIRKPGSIGSMYPQKVMKGKKMAGQMGSVKTTVKNQKVVLIDTDSNLLGIRGSVPGPNKSIVTIEGVSV